MNDPTSTPPQSSVPPTPGPAELAHALGLTVAALADRFRMTTRTGRSVDGVNPRTLYRWQRAGAPFTSEDDLRLWLGRQGACMPPKRPPSGDPLVGALAQFAPSTPAGQENTPRPRENADGSPVTATQEADWASADAKAARARREQIATDLLTRHLVHRDQVYACLNDCAQLMATGLGDLERKWLRRLEDQLGPEQRTAARSALTAEVLDLRASLATTIPARFQRLLTGD